MIEIITFVWCFTFVRKMVESTNLKMLQKPLGIKKSNTINNDKSIEAEVRIKDHQGSFKWTISGQAMFAARA